MERKRLLKLKDVLHMTALSKAKVYKLISDGTFPRQINLGGRSVAWVESDVIAWIDRLIEQNRDVQTNLAGENR